MLVKLSGAGSLTCHVGGVKRVKRKWEDVLSIAFFPQLGACVSIPQNNIIRRVNGQQQITGRILIPQPLQVWQRETQKNIEWNRWISTGEVDVDAETIKHRVASHTLDRFGVFLDLTVGCATHYIPHYDLSRGISWSQTQTVRWAEVVVVVFPWPFYLQNHTTHMHSDSEIIHHYLPWCDNNTGFNTLSLKQSLQGRCFNNIFFSYSLASIFLLFCHLWMDVWMMVL